VNVDAEDADGLDAEVSVFRRAFWINQDYAQRI
jgi:hypothetical protein